MNDRTTRAKIEIRLELRQLVLLSLGTMTFSGSLFAVGYWLGTRDGLQSASSPAAQVVRVDTTQQDPTRIRVKPTKAALGEVEFLFAKPASKKKRRKQPSPVVTKAVSKPEPVVVRRLPKLPVKAKTVEQPRVVLPALPELPGRLRAKAEQPRVLERPKVTDVAKPSQRELVLPGTERKAVQATAQKATPAKISPKTSDVKAVKVSALVSAIDAELREGSQARQSKALAPKASGTSEEGSKPVIAVTVAKSPSVQPTNVTEKVSKKRTPDHYFTVQVKAVTDKGEADSFSASLRAQGLKPNVVLANIPEKGRYYRIRVGKFTSLDEARRFHKQIKSNGKAGVGGFVTRY